VVYIEMDLGDMIGGQGLNGFVWLKIWISEELL
jgi:hypothetical protein